MSIVESIQNSLGLGKINPELEAYGCEFQQDGLPFTRIVEFYGNFARFRQIHDKYSEGRYLETSHFVFPNPNGEGLIIKPEGIYLSDGK